MKRSKKKKLYREQQSIIKKRIAPTFFDNHKYLKIIGKILLGLFLSTILYSLSMVLVILYYTKVKGFTEEEQQLYMIIWANVLLIFSLFIGQYGAWEKEILARRKK